MMDSVDYNVHYYSLISANNNVYAIMYVCINTDKGCQNLQSIYGENM